jgi:hypothetical protein
VGFAIQKDQSDVYWLAMKVIKDFFGELMTRCSFALKRPGPNAHALDGGLDCNSKSCLHNATVEQEVAEDVA